MPICLQRLFDHGITKMKNASEFVSDSEIRTMVVTALEERGWSQLALARASGLPAYTVNRIILGKTSVSLANRKKLSEVFGWGEMLTCNMQQMLDATNAPMELYIRHRADGFVDVRFNAAVPKGISTIIEAMARHKSELDAKAVASIMMLLV
ncbi:MAG TPA: helix-turn-helix transcriptional regulator [Novosphingobium sp.]|nr:helix-turn-helix transcriptional regulator [Novosphingobium sp.]